MALTVTHDDHTTTYPTATKWHVDDQGYLHLRNDHAQVATFNNISWNHVDEVDDKRSE